MYEECAYKGGGEQRGSAGGGPREECGLISVGPRARLRVRLRKWAAPSNHSTC
jgi:hypothetical protein